MAVKALKEKSGALPWVFWLAGVNTAHPDDPQKKSQSFCSAKDVLLALLHAK